MIAAWRAWIPVLLLLGVGVTQIALAKMADLSPWKGGGFGMFSTTDGTAFRYVRLFVEAPERSEEIAVPSSLDEAALRAQLFPADVFLTRLATAVAARERRRGRPVSLVRVEVWRIDFDRRPLKGTERRIRAFSLHVPPADRVSS